MFSGRGKRVLKGVKRGCTEGNLLPLYAEFSLDVSLNQQCTLKLFSPNFVARQQPRYGTDAKMWLFINDLETHKHTIIDVVNQKLLLLQNRLS